MLLTCKSLVLIEEGNQPRDGSSKQPHNLPETWWSHPYFHATESLDFLLVLNNQGQIFHLLCSSDKSVDIFFSLFVQYSIQ